VYWPTFKTNWGQIPIKRQPAQGSVNAQRRGAQQVKGVFCQGLLQPVLILVQKLLL
jgi:hypothetical protein